MIRVGNYIVFTNSEGIIDACFLLEDNEEGNIIFEFASINIMKVNNNRRYK